MLRRNKIGDFKLVMTLIILSIVIFIVISLLGNSAKDARQNTGCVVSGGTCIDYNKECSKVVAMNCDKNEKCCMEDGIK